MPLTWLSYMADNQLFKLNPWGFHLHNIILHIINTTLVYFIIKKLASLLNIKINSTHKYIILILGVLLWAIHPMRVEAVAWAVNRKGLLSSLFYLSSVLSYLHITTKNKKKIILLSTLFGVCALSSHPYAISLPILLLIIDMYPLNRYRFTQHPSPTYKITATFQDLIKLSIEKYILFMSCIAISSFTLIGQKSFGYLKNTYLEEKITTSFFF